MNFTKIKNQQGFGLGDLIFWIALISAGVWIYHQYILHPEGLNPRDSTHSVYEDKK